ncbi:MAG: hypothetical protein LBS48_06745 [Treponema sp.]|jgi:hypothetical protein|nr:hypothetical protein [Treponema sp.]
MKNLARLALFFSICFIAAFLASALLRFLGLWIDTARILPLEPEQSANFISALKRALPAAMYFSILLALSYASRRKMAVPLSILGVFVLATVFVLGFSLGIRQIQGVNFALDAGQAIRGRPGLILSQGDTVIVLLKEGKEGPRVVAFPGRPLFYQEVPRGPNNSILALPDLPFRDETPWFIQSIFIDLNLSARELDARLEAGLPFFCMYAGALILFLASLRFLLDLSNWPLANLFLGALAFRGILALETFLNAKETATLLGSFLGNRLPALFISPLVFCVLGALVILYTLLTCLARGGGGGND